MRLLCPNCAKELQVPDQYAGQMMKCPLCNGTFTVPALPSMPGAVSMPPPAPSVPPPAPIMTPPPAPMTVPPPSFAPAPPADGGARTLTISPQLVNWLTPVCLLGMFVLLFFDWVGMYPGGVNALTQSGFQAAFGSTSANDRWLSYSTKEKYWENYYGPDVEPLRTPGVSILLIFFILLLVPAMLLSLVASAIAAGVLKIAVPPALSGFWPMRFLLVAGLALGCLLLVVFSLWTDLPLEHRAYNQVKAVVEANRAKAPTAESQDQQRWDIELGIRFGGFAVHTTPWLSLVVILNVLAVLGAFMQFRMDRKGMEGLPSIQLR